MKNSPKSFFLLFPREVDQIFAGHEKAAEHCARHSCRLRNALCFAFAQVFVVDNASLREASH